MAKRVVKKVPAKDLKVGDMRFQVLNKGKPQPAADLKQSNPKDLRNKALREANKRASKAKVKTAKINFEKIIPKELSKSGQPDLTRPKSNVPRPGKAPWAPRMPKGTTSSVKVVASSAVNGVLKTVAKRVPLLNIFNPSFMSYKTGGAAGEGSDKTPKYGRSLRAEAEARKKAAFGTGGGNPKTVNPYRKPKDTVGNNPNRGIGTSKAKPKDTVGINPNRNMADTKPKTQMDNWKDKKKAQDKNPSQGQGAPVTSAAVKQPKGMTFQQAVRRNVTEEYTKKKMKPKGNLLGLLRKRKSMG